MFLLILLALCSCWTLNVDKNVTLCNKNQCEYINKTLNLNGLYKGKEISFNCSNINWDVFVQKNTIVLCKSNLAIEFDQKSYLFLYLSMICFLLAFVFAVYDFFKLRVYEF